MRVFARIIGDGSPGNPRRVNLPTYTMVAETDNGQLALVDVPDDDVPDDIATDGAERAIGPLRAILLSALSPKMRARLNARLDERYREHSGRFRPAE